ncbi:type 2 lanthipeptide synthetase LanM family protein [Streptomyces sp. NPDC048566]|uniref:type 2 lanthipeptide synthetase LanM family protein n=1 Tax=Streptomyces sp. NPDC048566 TaxID=3365569 RepID=UPI0037165CBA
MDKRTDRQTALMAAPARRPEEERETFLVRALGLAPGTDTPPPATEAGTLAELTHPLRPFATAARELLAPRAPSESVDLDSVWTEVAATLTERLARLAGHVLASELAAARDADELRGTTGPVRYRRFLGRLARRDRLGDVLARHPELARLLTDACIDTVTALTELLDRLAGDRAALAVDVLPAAATARLVGVGFGAGDRHAGRTVAVLRFACGERLVYKPRPLALHQSWNALLAWYRGILPGLAPAALAVLPRDGYGWAEFVPASPCADAGEVEAFYRRQGALLALCYAIDAVDLHCENVIAGAGQPVVVDVETLFHPAWRPRTDHGDDPALAALNDSVARTGLLPWLMDIEAGQVDISAFGAGHDGSGSEALLVPDWTDLGTDTMRIVRRSVPYAPAANRPVIDGHPVDPLSYGTHLQTGFAAGYRSILDHAEELTAAGGLLDAFAGLPIRVVVRPSHVYATMLTEATQPYRLTGPEDRATAFSALFAEAGSAHLRELAVHERSDLMAGDIPLFTGTTDARTLHTARGALVPVTLDATGLDAARAKILRMSEADLRRQAWLIAAALATKAAPAADAAPARPVTPQPLERGRLLALACRLGDEVIATSVRNSARTNWIGLERLDGARWAVQQCGAGLGDGHPGPALFLAQLGRLTGIERYTAVARRAAAALPGLVQGLARHTALSRQVGPGGFFGVGGICYALCRLATLLDDDRLRASLSVALRALAASLADEHGQGVGLGLAGGLAALRAVHTETGEPLAGELGGRLAERLDDRDRTGGFLHGGAGVRWAAGAAPVPPPPGRDLSWSTGLAGAALAAAGRPGGEPVVRSFLDAAAGHEPLRDQSLCTGELGILDVLIELEQAGYAEARRLSTIGGSRLLGAVEQYGLRCGTPNEVPTPGLLYGTAGIGYGLLRLAEPAAVPSVLALRPGPGRN